MKQIMIDSSTLNTLILILKKKVHRFLFRFMSTQERKLWKIVRVALIKWNPDLTKNKKYIYIQCYIANVEIILM